MSKTINMPVLNEGQNTATNKAGTMWALTDPETGRIALTTRGLLAVYTSRDAARAAKAAGRLRVTNPRVERFEA